ncbi:AraC family transcriptional regulator [Reichenbachiella versicolor]|uniref:AraC family transcriptional regulator n=1 Tax=Reichenbachiella versicolor TaxID=1821036 RepID=UPI000D6DE684|nr:AraC family transcriptional regulator [Reichenbachiella versicolor]
MKIYNEITPVTSNDIFVSLDHKDAKFDYPVHRHPEFELNLVINSTGNRIVGDSVEVYQELDLVLIGPRTYHCWESKNSDGPVRVITIQFEEHFTENDILSKKSLKHIRQLLLESVRGISFSGETRLLVCEKMKGLNDLNEFESILEFLRILNILASSSEKNFLCSEGFSSQPDRSKNRRINEVYDFVLKNYQDPHLNLHIIAQRVNMSDSAFSHFFKKRTNKSFTQFIIDMRIGKAVELLNESEDSVSQICYSCGFNNVSNFNRLFKKNKGVTPREFRSQFQDLSPSNFTDRKEYLIESSL